jgi:hypothetical protein
MPKTVAEIAALESYSDADMLKLVRWAIAEIMSNPDGASVSVAGRSFSQINLAELRGMEQFYSNRVALASRGGRIRLGALQ